jgi:hypothetical protein
MSHPVPHQRPVRALLAASAFALLWAAALPAAHAAANFVPGAACQPTLNDARYQVYQGNHGVQNRGSESFNVVCPVVRPAGPGGITVWVDGWVTANTTITCLLNSSAYDGSTTAYRIFTFTGPATAAVTPFDKQLTMSVDEADDTSYQTVMCSLPPNRKAMIRGLMVKT